MILKKMENRQNTYGQQQIPEQGMMPPQGPMMPRQIPMQNRAPRGWRERWMHRFGMDTAAATLRKGELTIPSWLIGSSIAFFFIAMFACWAAFGYVPAFDLWMVAAISVVLFFYGGQSLSRIWAFKNEKHFLRYIFIIGFLVRFIWVLYLYFNFNPEQYQTTYGDGGDVTWYMPFGQAIADWIRNGFNIPFSQLQETWDAAIDDTGYPFWLAMINLLTGGESDVFIPLIVKCIIGSYSAILIYKVAKRHFGEGTARMAAIFICVNPNMIYWCGTMLKETEMVFIVCLAVFCFDNALSSGKRLTFTSLLPGLLAGMYLMFFRTALGLVVFLAVFAHIVMASKRVMSTGKKILAGVLVTTVLMVAMGDRIRTQSRELVDIVQSDAQQKNMEWRATRRGGGNTFAKYAGKAVFAPLIFSIPFPTFNKASESQILQMQQSGGYYIKNILSFFVILVMFMMLISGEWRRHVFIIAYTCGYLMVLVMSFYAQSGRFHMPIMPMLMLFAAYGVQVAKNNKRIRKWFPLVLVLEVVICLGWNWFKLKGRGMI